MNAVIDASVAVKWFVAEKYTDEASLLHDEYVDGTVTLGAPAVLPFEVANGLRYSDRLNDEHVEAAMKSLAGYGIRLVPFAEIEGVIELALDADASIYDTAYVALAAREDCRCYTADERLIDALPENSPVTHIREFEN